MKPNFALKLSHDGIEILQRAASGWVATGSTRFDITDLDGKLRQLRQEAEALAPDGLRSKLIMPDSEVRYATVIAPGPTDEARRLQIEAEIEGLTPYALHELAYDYVVEGEHALVAICAREILAEAEGFAQTHGFNPVSFAAIPPAGAFAGEPFFGETAGARAFLSRNTSVERDREPVRIAGQQKPSAPAKPAPPARPAAPHAPARPSVDSGSPAAAAGVGAGVAGAKAGAAATGSAASAAPEAFSRVGNLVRRMGTRIRREQAQAGTGETAKPTQPPATRAAPETPPKPSAAAQTPAPNAGSGRAEASKSASPGTTAPVTSGKPAAKAATPGTPEPVAQAGNTAKQEAPVAPAKPSTDKPADPQGVKTPPVAFSSRRSPPPPPNSGSGSGSPAPTLASDGPGARSGKASPGGRIAVLPAGGEKERPGRMTRLYRRGRRAAKGALVSIGLAKPAEGGGKRRGERKRDARAAPQPVVAASVPPANEREKATEAEALTIFGARNMQRTETGFARRGLMLTAGLLLLLVAVAIWAVYFATGPAREADVAQVPQDEIAALPPIDAPAQVAEPEPEAGITAPAPVAPPAEEDAQPSDEPTVQEPEVATDETAADVAPEAGQVTDPDALLEELVQEALTEAMPVDLLGQTEESMVPSGESESPGVADETALEGIESPPAIVEGESDAEQRLALPPVLERPQLAEIAPVSPPPPPPFGTEFSLGPDGLVEATPEGAMTPTGVMVYAGPPSEVPPARPAGIAPPEPEAEAAPETQAAPDAQTEPQTEAMPEPEAQVQPPEEAGETAVAADDTPPADPALAGMRPQPRSPLVAELAAQASAAEEGAAPEPATETTPDEAPDTATGAPDPEDDNAAATPPPGGVLLDGLRPQRRPTDLVPPETAVAEVEPEADEAPEVVAVSLRPTARPGDISARVQESLAAARSAPAAAPAAAAAAAAPAPAASAAPNIPTSASVAQQATQARAINLRRVNLVGVFGTPNDRRALVRLSNGQVVRVQVGDRLDGGQVSAIGDDELRYVKNGRNEVLRIGSSG